MHILLLNWRCPLHPQAGGAEIVTLRHAVYWAQKGHQVTWFAGGDRTLKRKEWIEGVLIVRFLHPLLSYFGAPLYYWLHRGRFDLVIDEAHGIPYFSPFWAWKSRIVLFIHEIARGIWDAMFPWPLNILGRTIEKIYLFFYRNVKVWTATVSIARDLVRNGITEDAIYVIPHAIDAQPLTVAAVKNDHMMHFVTCSRLVPMKGIHTAIQFFAKIHTCYPMTTLTIIGVGDTAYTKRLQQLIIKEGCQDVVKWAGKISNEEKYHILYRAHWLLHFSIHEGFGLTVLEANSQSTPVLGHDVAGLRDIIRSGYNGYIGTDDYLYKQVVSLYENKAQYDQLQNSCLQEVKKYQWEHILNLVYKRIVCGENVDK